LSRRGPAPGPRPRLVGVVGPPLAGGATALVFLHLARGLGDRTLSLMALAHDLAAVTAVALLAFQLTRRPWTSAATGVLLALLIHLASEVKTRAVFMPAVGSDLWRIVDAWPVILALGGPAPGLALASIALLALLLFSERARPLAPSGRVIAAALVVPALGVVTTVHARLPLDADSLTGAVPKLAMFLRSLHATPAFADRTIEALGPYCCFRDARPPVLEPPSSPLPHLVVVLQESTFPPQHLQDVPAVRNRLLDGAVPLQVDTVGGGTWVAEYALLHGIAPPVYGPDYLQVLTLGPRLGLQGRLLPILSRAGYRSVAILPFARSILNGESIYRSLGFDQLIDCGDIDDCRSLPAWGTLPDRALYDRALEILRATDGPRLVYLPTIRQHSPHIDLWPSRAHRAPVLAEYLRRLDLSAREADEFLEQLRGIGRPTLVLMFGDHIPAHVNAVFSDDEFVVPRTVTFFNLYDPSMRSVAGSLMAEHPAVRVPHVAFLDALLLGAAGFRGEYVERKLAMMRDCAGRFCTDSWTSQPLAGAAAAPR